MVHKPSSLAYRRPQSDAASETPPSDQAIAQGVAQGMEWAAEALYGRVQPVVDQCLRRILRATGPDYDDLMQAAFERIITVLSRKPLGGKCDLRAWSAAVATHVALDSLRRRGRERRLFQWQSDTESSAQFYSGQSGRTKQGQVYGEHQPGQPSAEGRLEARSEVSRIQQILVKMKPGAAQTLLLHDVLGYELTEVAQLTGVSIAAAQSRLVRSRRELLRRARSVAPKGLR